MKVAIDHKPSLTEKCAVFGVFGEGMEAARLTHLGLWALQHRGQESSGIASSDGKKIKIHKGEGLVAHIYDEQVLENLPGYIAIGHNRYGTSGGHTVIHSQPVIDRNYTLAFAHNGNLPSFSKIQSFLIENKVSVEEKNDSEMMFEIILYFYQKGLTIEKAIEKSIPFFTGAYSLLVMTKDKLIAIRDHCGIRPLSLGKLNGGYIFSSETCALDVIKATFVRDVKPGEMVVIDKNGIKSHQLQKSDLKLDIFELIYFARPDSMLMGKRVNDMRKRMGEELFKEYPIKADVVIPVPDSGIPAAIGFANASKIPFDYGLMKNRYIHRTFIRPVQKLREKDVQIKLNPIPEVIKDKKIVVIDDSIVRGTTSKKLVSILREAGAKSIHLYSSSPPVRFPDFYGINTPHQEDLIASRMTVKQITEYTGADSVCYLSLKGVIKAIGVPEENLSTSCLTGNYPIDIGERANEVDFSQKIESPV